MSQDNSNNDTEQENQHQPNFILPVVNSGNERGRKESGKAEDSPEEPVEKVVGKAKYVKPSPKRKAFKQKKRRLSTSSSSESEETERKRRKKKRSGRKRKRNSPSSSSSFSRSDSTTDLRSEVKSGTAVKKD